MLPFLKNRPSPGLIVAERAPDNKDEQNHGLEAAMEDLCKALESKDYKAAAKAFKDAIDINEDEPKEDESSYDMMNQKAADQENE